MMISINVTTKEPIVIQENTQEETSIISDDTTNAEIDPNVLVVDPAQTFKTAWASGIKIVKDTYGHTFTAALMAKASTGPYTTALYYNGSRASTLINSDSSFKKILTNHKASMGTSTNKTFSSSSAFTSGELFTSLHKYNYEITIYQNLNTKKWHYTGYITDTYDFVWSNYNSYYNNFGATLGNNVAAAGLKAGYIKSFPIKIFVDGNL